MYMSDIYNIDCLTHRLIQKLFYFMMQYINLFIISASLQQFSYLSHFALYVKQHYLLY
jgi:hypothetical protein